MIIKNHFLASIDRMMYLYFRQVVYMTQQDPIQFSKKAKDVLSKSIYGQESAIDSISDIFKNKILFSKNAPRYTFLFLGPPATGKTEMARAMLNLFPDYNYLQLNMVSYQSFNDGQSLFGTERGWSSEANGILTTHIKKHPKSIILFDEFEKAHVNIQRRLLPLLSEGAIYDTLGWLPKVGGDIPFNSLDDDHKKNISKIITKIDCSKTIVIFTTNLGSNIYNSTSFLESLKNDPKRAETMILQELAKEKKITRDGEEKAIVPELLSRLSQSTITLFERLDTTPLLQIAAQALSKNLSTLVERYKFQFSFNKFDNMFLYTQVFQFAPEIDVRRLKSKVYEQFTDKITDYLEQEEKSWSNVKAIEIDVDIKAQQFIRRELIKRSKSGELLKYLLRKNLALDIDDTIIENKGVLTYKIQDLAFKKVQRSEDVTGQSAIAFDVPDVSFDDIHGHKESIRRLKEIAILLKKPKLLKKFNAKVPKGMLLYGVPGTGKTILAKAFANYAELPFIATTANDLIDLSTNDYTRMKEVFKRAKDYAPSIIFIDEIDTFGSRNDDGFKSAINELLTQINGFDDEDDNIFIIAATNYKERIDDAILRAGRIELHIEIPTLDKSGRKAFWSKILQGEVQENIDIEKLVRYTAGLTGAQIEKIANESALYAIRTQKENITEAIFIEQINSEKYGKRILPKSIDQELKEVAYHEAGHAVIAKLLIPNLEIEQITIIPRENSAGFVSFYMEEFSKNLSKKEIEAKIAIAFAGRVAQIKYFNEEGIDTGAYSDLQSATEMAYKYVAYYGMDEEIGHKNIINVNISDLAKAKIDKAVDQLLKKVYEKTVLLVEQNFDTIEKVAKKLLKTEHLSEKELTKLLFS